MIKRVEKPWGYELWFAHNDKYAGKLLFIKKGSRLSLQYHKVKRETLYCQSGCGFMMLNGKAIPMKAGEAIDINVGQQHRYEALTDTLLFEVSTPELDDVVRVEDDYGRKGT